MKATWLAIFLFWSASLGWARDLEAFEPGDRSGSLPMACAKNVGAFSTTDTLWIGVRRHWEDADLTIRVKACSGEPGRIPTCVSLDSEELGKNRFGETIPPAPRGLMSIRGATLHARVSTFLKCPEQVSLLIELADERWFENKRHAYAYVPLSSLDVEAEVNVGTVELTLSKIVAH